MAKAFLFRKNRVLAAALAAVVTLAGAFTGARAESRDDLPVVSDAIIAERADATRLELVFDSAIRPEMFTLSDDYRLVLDMPEVNWKAEGGETLEGEGVVHRLRYARNRPGHSRIVLDLAGPAEIASSDLDKKRGSYRFVVELRKTSKEDFMRTAGWPVRQNTQTADAAAQKTAAPSSPLDIASIIAGRLAPAPQKAAPKKVTSAKPVIVIDAGHGGKDPGAIGITGVYEKDIALDTALALRDSLEASGRYTVHMTRDRDVFVKLKERVTIARDKQASLFISLHADSNPNQNVRGTSVYTLSEKASDTAAARHARRENAITGLEKDAVTDDVLKILIELAQRDTMNNSVRFAQGLLPQLERQNVGLLRNTHRFGPFYVLTAADVPSVLIEMGFVSNKADTKQMTSKRWRKKLVAGIQTSVDRYFGMEEIAGMIPAHKVSALR